MQRSSRLPLISGLALTVVLLALAWVGAVRWAEGLNPFALGTRLASGPVVLDQIQRLNRLETCKYNGQVVVEGKKRNWLPGWMAGDRILFVGRGEVVAGVDLASLHPDDVAVHGSAVTLHLPEPEILHASLDNHQSQVYDRQSGMFTGPDAQLETQVRVEAEDKIRRAAVDNGVLQTAKSNAQDTLRRHLGLLGFRDVRFL